jgi:hypothetical protein
VKLESGAGGVTVTEIAMKEKLVSERLFCKIFTMHFQINNESKIEIFNSIVLLTKKNY